MGGIGVLAGVWLVSAVAVLVWMPAMAVMEQV